MNSFWIEFATLIGAAVDAAVLADYWRVFLAALTLLLSVLASGHAILHKRDSRAAVSWVGFIWLVPLLGASLYFILGVNRIRRRAMLLRSGRTPFLAPLAGAGCPAEHLQTLLPAAGRHLVQLGRYVEGVVGRPLLAGNRIDPLVNGDEAYPAMLDAIRRAERSVAFSTYIFDHDRVGVEFAEALGAASRRGVSVRVLIDAAGIRYSWPSILPVLRGQAVNYARFLPTFPGGRLLAINLRTHRKILVIDGTRAFTGGMNIRQGHVLQGAPRSPVQDLHFRVEGPVVAQLQEIFADDWLFTTGEELRGREWFPPLGPVGPVLSRAIPDGPDDEIDKLPWSIKGALSLARSSVKIVTPYFLPDGAMISALNVAAMRGVAVDIILPEQNNLPLVHWASRALWWQLLQRGCRIWLTPPPFDHTKLMLVDGTWSMIGSANWDPRSMRLNFECNLESYDSALALRLQDIIQRKLHVSRPVSLDEVDGRSLPGRLRDGAARLLTPYL